MANEGSIQTSSYKNRKGAERVSVVMDRSDAEKLAGGDKAIIETIRNQAKLIVAG